MRNRLCRIAAISVAIASCVVFAGQAQMPDPGMQPYPQYPAPTPYPAPAPEKGAFKKMFAGTLAAVLTTTGAGLATGLATVMTGAIQNWFNRPPKAQSAMAMDSGAMGSTMPGAPMTGMPGATMDSMGGMGTTPGMPSAGMGMPAAPSGIVAGLAYEVQLLGRDGQTMTVDPAMHSFASGDRFVVMYRPSLPGEVAIYNVNPLGQEKRIDSVNVAAGELTRLGPYEFRDATGTETLRLILSPCRNDALLATTRDIVKVEEMPNAMGSGMAPTSMPGSMPTSMPPSLGLQDCAVVASRSVRPETRDIVKVGAEDGTMFALDPVSQQEMTSGDFTARQLTLTFNHR